MRCQCRSGLWTRTTSGLDPADLPADVAAQLLGRLELAVGVAEVGHVVHPEHLAGCALLGLADAGDLAAGDGGVEAAGVAVGADAVGDLDAGLGEQRHRAAGAEVDVVRMGGHDEYPLDRVLAPALQLPYDEGVVSGCNPTATAVHS